MLACYRSRNSHPRPKNASQSLEQAVTSYQHCCESMILYGGMSDGVNYTVNCARQYPPRREERI